MMNKFTALLLISGVLSSSLAKADQTIDGQLLLSSVSDGTVPAYDCSVPTLPFNFPGGVDASAAIGVIAAGEPLVNVSFTSCDFSTEQPFQCSFTCAPVSAAACIGIDCVNGENFDDTQLKLKENNVRIRLTNTQVAAQTGAENVMGESWNIAANDSANGGPSNFDFQVKSVEADTLLSDGGAKAYDCADLAVTKYQPGLTPVVGFVPLGQPYFIPTPIGGSCEFTTGYKCLHTCEANTRLQHTTVSYLSLGTADNGSVAIGYNPYVKAQTEQGVVAIGYDQIKRQLRHVGDAVVASDVLNVEGLSFSRLEAIKAQLGQLNSALDALEVRIDEYEDSLSVDVPLAVDGETLSLDLSKSQYLYVEDTRFDEPYGPRAISFGFSPIDGLPLDGLTVVDADGNTYSLSAWWQVIERPLNPDVVSLTVVDQPGRQINVQWWYQW
jgi:hypothetical protein